MTSVRTRIAPSPTGDPHVGTAYIALFNYCFTQQHGGEFILRIEDTDQARSTQASEDAILNALRWSGLTWSEGPDVGGQFGPYRQSERKAIYSTYIDQLLADNHAFYCFRTPDELEAIREARKAKGLNPGIKGDLALPDDEVKRRLDANEPYVIRMHVPDEGVCVIQDELRGEIEVEWSQVDCQILLKSDGMPTYHLASVVDDHLMEISHVIRGEEWISSTPKHILLYQYLDWTPPTFCHMPLLRNPDKSKLSKRKNPTSIGYYQRMGFMPEALVNYLGRMGWSMPDEREKFSLDEMIAAFDISRVSLGGPVFDVEKLEWLNGVWLRENLDAQQFIQAFCEWGLNRDYLGAAIPHVQSRVNTFSDVVPLAGFLLSGAPDISADDFAQSDDLVKQLQFTLWRFDALREWNKASLLEACQFLAEQLDVKLKALLAPLFIAITGKSNSISVLDSMEILGSDMSRARIRQAIEVLGGLSKKQLKKVEKAYRVLPSE
ncbi:MAG: glutamate--tRNA ligase [Pseudomonadota bacterium]